jgi:uncharacterized protein
MNNDTMKIAIIGTGISGLGAAYLLAQHHDVQIYEKNAYIGGHSRTIEINDQGKSIPVDTGFIVFNNWNYPNLLGLFKELDVPYVNSDMSFGVSIDKGWLEYSSGDLTALRNLVRPQYWGMLRDILRFNKEAHAYIEKDADISLGQCLDELKMGEWFRQYYLLAMGAAIWSCPVDTIMDFPARTFLRFFKNHGLLSVKNRPQWYTVQGGSREYVQRLTPKLHSNIRLNCGVQIVRKQGDKIEVLDSNGHTEIYDQIIFACHADEALKMIEQPTALVQDIIGSFSYQDNTIIVHSDVSFMPERKKCWASWVYLSDDREDHNTQVSLSYWMNNLQPLQTETPVLVTLNPGRRPQENLIYDEHVFAHPVFDQRAINAQTRLSEIQGIDGFWFCGAYQRYGFHEDGLLSAVNIAKAMGVRIPWE